MNANQILESSKYATLTEMAEAWLGDWSLAGMSDEEAIELAARCEARQQAGDSRGYSEIVADEMK